MGRVCERKNVRDSLGRAVGVGGNAKRRAPVYITNDKGSDVSHVSRDGISWTAIHIEC